MGAATGVEAVAAVPQATLHAPLVGKDKPLQSGPPPSHPDRSVSHPAIISTIINFSMVVLNQHWYTITNQSIIIILIRCTSPGITGSRHLRTRL